MLQVAHQVVEYFCGLETFCALLCYSIRIILSPWYSSESSIKVQYPVSSGRLSVI